MVEFNSNIKRVVVTGGAGFIGGALIRKLLTDYDVKVFNLDKLSYASNLESIQQILDNKKNIVSNKYQLINVDLSNFEKTQDAISIADPDFVFHLAAESHVDRSIDGPRKFLESNVLGTFNLLQALLSHWEGLSNTRKTSFRMHHISTDEVFGSLQSEGRFTETTPYDPRSPYSATKAASDHLVSAWHHTYGLPVIITNCSNNYGPWQFPEKLIPLVILKCLSQQEIPLYGDGMNIRDWLYVDDHIDALLVAAIHGKLGCSYCVGAQEEKTNKYVVEKICKHMDSIKPIKGEYSMFITPVRDRPGHDRRYSINPELITSELGWKPRFNFDDGLKKTIEWYLNNQSWCKDVLTNANYSINRLGLN
tara:strand:- start:3159 stop:4250 length:1092 start_codon:yes stop_codon:yes gene_type:complete